MGDTKDTYGTLQLLLTAIYKVWLSQKEEKGTQMWTHTYRETMSTLKWKYGRIVPVLFSYKLFSKAARAWTRIFWSHFHMFSSYEKVTKGVPVPIYTSLRLSRYLCLLSIPIIIFILQLILRRLFKYPKITALVRYSMVHDIWIKCIMRFRPQMSYR
jgi:hypothetical protein